MKPTLNSIACALIFTACSSPTHTAVPSIAEVSIDSYGYGCPEAIGNFSSGLGPPYCPQPDTRPWPRPLPVISKIEPTAAQRGETVTIFGSQLKDAIVGFRGSRYVSPVSNSETEVVIKVPDDAVTGKIQLSNRNAVTFSDMDFKVLRPVIYVREDATGKGNGKSWETAFSSLQDALNAAIANDEIWVAAGIYRPAAAGSSRESTFQLKQQVDIYGGFKGTESSLAERDPLQHVVILSGDLNANDNGSLDVSDPSRSDNVEHVVMSEQRTLLDGLTIRDGNGREPHFLIRNQVHSGAGMLIKSSSVTLNNVTFSHNVHINAGGGLSILKNAYGGRFTGLRFIRACRQIAA